MKNRMKTNRKIIAAAAVLFLIAVGTLFAFLTPYPAAWMVKKVFSMTHYVLPENYEALKNEVLIERDINYNSAYPNGVLDLISPKTGRKDKVIFWVHGGGYVGDDKKKVEHYMVMLASKGYLVININYALAPKHCYPVQLKQIEEAWVFVKRYIKDEKVYFGGDSAGAQLAAQFVNLQTDEKYADALNENLKNIKIGKVVDKDRIGGVILFCGPYKLKELLRPPKDTMKLPFKQIGWAYFGTKDIEDRRLELTDVIANATSSYPPAFITDGNTASFENQAKELAQSLEKCGVYVKTAFYPKEEAVLTHEYQFNMNTPYAQKTFNCLLDFIERDKV
ncbi:MAG: alpha/beta hydrolase, partial [Endomicrobium sp.]|nr:alpha/beta hydrolase [Endomicrobium sp.]